MCTHQLCASAAVCVQFLFLRHIDRATSAHAHVNARVTFKVRMHRKRCINPPLDNVDVINGQIESVLPGPVQIFLKIDQLLPIIPVGLLGSRAQHRDSLVSVGSCSLASE